MIQLLFTSYSDFDFYQTLYFVVKQDTITRKECNMANNMRSCVGGTFLNIRTKGFFDDGNSSITIQFICISFRSSTMVCFPHLHPMHTCTKKLHFRANTNAIHIAEINKNNIGHGHHVKGQTASWTEREREAVEEIASVRAWATLVHAHGGGKPSSKKRTRLQERPLTTPTQGRQPDHCTQEPNNT